MNCEWVKQNATLLLYDELPDDARHELEQHVALCKGCAAELEEMRLLHRAFNMMPVVEPTPNLLALSRMKLTACASRSTVIRSGSASCVGSIKQCRPARKST